MAHDIDIPALVDQAEAAKANAHAPYSKFHVGAAVLYSDGSIVTGCNVENASFGATICAERNALAAGIALGKSAKPIAICVSGNTPKPLTPCGICRQSIWEIGKDILVICADERGHTQSYKISELLPHAFDLDD